MENIEELRDKQESFYKSGKTRSWEFRKKNLIKLRESIKKHKSDILVAIEKDLNKGEFEATTSEILVVLEEIKFFLKKGKSFAKVKKVKKTLLTIDARSYIHPTPYGLTLILSPWNYPFNLSMLPLIGAVASGNCVIVKPSSVTENISLVIKRIIDEAFDEAHVATVLGSREQTDRLLSCKFDKIFFTGSMNVGKIVLEKASKTLTPCVLELGGKSPAIIDKMKEEHLEKSLKRIIWGKFINSGQTCVSPDYIIAHTSLKEEIPNIFKKIMVDFEEERKLHKIINKKHYDRICSYLKEGNIIYGGEHNDENMSISMTLIEPENIERTLMKEEIFGPVLPILYFNKKEECVELVSKICDSPLALYIFSNRNHFVSYMTNNLRYGGASINDTITHIVNNHLPFGGVGGSGMGTYHGHESFNCFSRMVGILKKNFKKELPFRYPPYKKRMKAIDLLYKHFSK